MVTHSTASSEMIVAGLSDSTLGSRIDRVVSLAPCMFLDLLNFELPIGDRPSAEALFGILAQYDINTLFGPFFKEELETKMCPTNLEFCQILLGINETYMTNYPAGGSKKNFSHFLQMSIEKRF